MPTGRKRIMGVVTPGKPVETRLDLLEHELHSQGDILKSVVSALSDIKEFMAKQPVNSSWLERISIVGATAGLVIAGMSLANGWLDSKLAPDRQIISQLSRHTDNYPVLSYRLDEIEKLLEATKTTPPLTRSAPAP